MIKKIKSIKSLGIFKDFHWERSLSDFQKYNIIYGWNGCGKTTLSNLFGYLEFGFSEDHPNLEYQIETQDGIYKNNQQFSGKIRVFNQDYVQKNVQILSSKANPIFILGEENKVLVEKIKIDEKTLAEDRQKLADIVSEYSQLEREKSRVFTDIARTISSNTSGEATRRYDKRNAEEAFTQITDKLTLSDQEQSESNLTLRQLERPILEKVVVPTFFFNGLSYELINGVAELSEQAKYLCSKMVQSIVIERLIENPDLSIWVEKGMALHIGHGSKKCEFCGGILSEERLGQLSAFFNDADRLLKHKIDSLIEDLRRAYTLINETKFLEKANLYEELQQRYQSKIEPFIEKKAEILENLAKIAKVLEEKKLKTTESLSVDFELDTFGFTSLVGDLNEVLGLHNAKTSNFKYAKDKAQKLLELHYLSSISDAADNINLKIKQSKEQMEKQRVEVEVLRKKIEQDKSRISSSHKACEAINRGVETFLGRNEITFEVEQNGYAIKRNGVVAKNLSEGEKTAIAFVYFTVHLQEQNFDLQKWILVIDDPISSLDSNSLFQAFAFLKNTVMNAKQVFILTHNFDFLRLILNWMKGMERQKIKSGYYMIKNHDSGSGREAKIDGLDKDLKSFESEYHYLFKLLYTFQSDGTIASVYHIPNIARKTLETFLMFRVPNSDTLYDKLQTIKASFDENKLTAIYKFTNDQSHVTGKGFDPSLVLETQKSVKYILEMMEATFPEHYQILKASFS